MKKIKIGVMGGAAIARRSVLPALKILSSEFEVVAIASRSQEKAMSFASEFGCKPVVGYGALLEEDLDAVYVPLPTGLHDEWINKALDAGLHVYAEKSIASSCVSAQNMVSKARSENRALMEGYMFQYHSQHGLVKKMIADGEIGSLRCFRSSFGFPPLNADNFRYDNEVGGGVVFDAAGYTVKATHMIMGSNYEVVASSLYKDPVHGTATYGGAFLKASNGIPSEIAFGFDNFYQCNYEIWGAKGKITAERAFTAGPDHSPSLVVETATGRKVLSLDKDNHFVKAMLVFHGLIRGVVDREKHYADIVLQSQCLDAIVRLADK